MSFVHLHAHSHYSLLEAIGSPLQMIKQIHALGMDTLAITDYGGLYGVIEFVQSAKKQSIKPIVGVELGLVADRTYKPKGERAGTIVLLAQSLTGYQNLIKLVSEGQLTGFHGIPRIDFASLQQRGSGLICLLGGHHSWLYNAILQQEQEGKIEEQVRYLQSLLGNEAVYLNYLVQPYALVREAEKTNNQLMIWADTWSLPIVPTVGTHYVHATDKELLEVALAIKDGKRVYDADRRQLPGNRHLLSEEEVCTVLREHGRDEETIAQWCQATVDLAARIDLEIPLGKAHFPTYTPDHAMEELYSKRKNTLVIDEK